MTERRRPPRDNGFDWLKAILVVAVLLAIFAGTTVIARQEAALPAVAPTVAAEVILPGSGGSEERLQLPPVATAISGDSVRAVARSRSSR